MGRDMTGEFPWDGFELGKINSAGCFSSVSSIICTKE